MTVTMALVPFCAEGVLFDMQPGPVELHQKGRGADGSEVLDEVEIAEGSYPLRTH